ncbi:hypothetical protein KJ656_06240 [bacterium]|nr:hypothetical protein [bacterium]
MNSREQILNLIQAMIADGILKPQDLSRFLPSVTDPFNAEYVREALEKWYINIGIEGIIGRKFSLSRCPFNKNEIEEASKKNEIILCVPKGVTSKQLGNLFRFRSWAFEDMLVTSYIDKEDFWFKAPKTFEPPAKYSNKTAKQIRRIFEDEGKLGLSLQRYLVFIARMRHLTGRLPDMRWWTWLLNSKYDRSAYLLAGFDPNGKFSVHAWMSDFRAKFLSARYAKISEGI